jgi:hypothetical protein
MPLNLENVNEQVTDNIASETPTLAAPVPATPAAPPPPPADELSKLRDEVAQLRREQAVAKASSEASLTEARLQTAREIAHAKHENPGNGAADIALHRAITATGGPAFWARLSPAEKAVALGVEGAEQVKDADLKKIFGPSSDGAAANRLAKSDPAEYQRLRKLARIRNLF